MVPLLNAEVVKNPKFPPAMLTVPPTLVDAPRYSRDWESYSAPFSSFSLPRAPRKSLSLLNEIGIVNSSPTRADTSAMLVSTTGFSAAAFTSFTPGARSAETIISAAPAAASHFFVIFMFENLLSPYHFR